MDAEYWRTLATLPRLPELHIHFVILPAGDYDTWQEAVNAFLQDTPEIHFVGVGPGEKLEDLAYARVLVINAE